MSILDDAIREHLELKRQHGADESELKKLEDEAFGPPGRPDEPNSLNEAPTEFLAAEAVETPSVANGEEAGRRRINVTDLQEPPPPAPSESADDPVAEPPADELQGSPEPETEPESEPEPEPELEPEPSHSTEERHAIAEQPTELFDVEGEIASEEEPPADVPSPTDEEIVDVEAAEPKLAPTEPATEIYASRSDVDAEPVAAETSSEEDDEDDFFSEQRLSDELDQALEAPLSDEQDEDEEYEDEPEPDEKPESGHEDVLEDTPDFLEDAPEDDELWFEQRPPKDFDFDD